MNLPGNLTCYESTWQLASLDKGRSKVELNGEWALQKVDASFDVLCKDFICKIAIYA